MKKLLGIVVLGLLLNNCAGSRFVSDPEDYRNTPENKLCISYWAGLYGNRGSAHTDAKRTMITERNLDCAPYEREGQLEGERNDRFAEDLFKSSSSNDKKRLKCKTLVSGNIRCTEY